MSGWVKGVILAVVLAVAGYVTYDRVGRWHQRSVETAKESAKLEQGEEEAKLEREVVRLRKELELQQSEDMAVPREKIQEIFGEDAASGLPGVPKANARAEGSTEGPAAEKPVACEDLDNRLRDFFAYLDNQEYVKAYNLPQGTRTLFEDGLQRLSTNLPLVVGEMKDLVMLAHNVAHFYRVLGKTRLQLIRDVLGRESDVAEPSAALFYESAMARESCQDVLASWPGLEPLYEYASFFLNTLAGKSYLSRRDPNVRVLTQYYCTLIIDRANDEELNRYGIDLRPHIDAAYHDIRSQRGLAYRGRYLAKLETLRAKYGLGAQKPGDPF